MPPEQHGPEGGSVAGRVMCRRSADPVTMAFMPRPWPILDVSLATKCQLLFGASVLLIIAAALFVPGYYMERLVDEMNERQVRHLARLARARVNPASSDWDEQESRLHQWWTDHATELELPEAKPRLIPLATGAPDMTGPALLAMIEAWRPELETAHRRIRRVLEGVDPPPTWRLAWAGYRAAGDRLKDSLDDEQRDRIRQVLRKIVARGPRPALDAFETDCVRKMRANHTLNELGRTIHRPGVPVRHQIILAVRGASVPPDQHPLVAVIDMTAPPPDLNALLWTRVILVLAGVLAGFLAVLVFYLVSQKLILAPVRELTALVKQIAGGDRSARSEIATGDEFEELSDAFNQMLGQLEKSRNELQTINRSLDTRLGELAETNVSLFEANRLKGEFLANVSHELRTPLTSIIGFGDLLNDSARGEGPIDKTRTARYAGNILTSGRMLLDIINDLLDLAKIEAGKIELHRSKFSLREACEALADFTKPLIDKKGLVLQTDLDDRLPTMDSDAGKLRQILYNLLSNAIKYTPEGGRVSLIVRPCDHGSSVRLEVADTGPGIAPEDLEQIFEKFQQLDASVTREHSGTGLGLAISRELCQMLGGKIRVESTLGVGSRFIVELPEVCPARSYRPMPSLT